jgi:hypothetical protein
MKSVFLVQHLHTLDDECEDVKIIGIYRTREAALAAIEKVKDQPGFEEFPELRNPLEDYAIIDTDADKERVRKRSRRTAPAL